MYISTGLRQPRERCKVLAGYTRKILYIIITEFRVSERLHRGPEFFHNYLMDYTIGLLMIT